MQHNNWGKDKDLLSEAYMTQVGIPVKDDIVVGINTDNNKQHSDQEYSGDKKCSHEEHDSSEIHMALSELKKTIEYASELENMLKSANSLEGWTAAKITKASDYLSSVYHWLDYDENKDVPNHSEDSENY
jgi:hypothetical protein|tara:strand:+ start:4504 stop:4893 length:390 start_codon:yes stop_codon:yes gene_type:complete